MKKAKNIITTLAFLLGIAGAFTVTANKPSFANVYYWRDGPGGRCVTLTVNNPDFNVPGPMGNLPATLKSSDGTQYILYSNVFCTVPVRFK